MEKPAKMALPERFWARVDKSGASGCWLWTGAKNNYGYGVIFVDGKRDKAHRYSWQLHNGEIPVGRWVLHHCDVRNCVNPAHLFLGTNQDNDADKVQKGRQAHGEKLSKTIPNRRLTADQVREARRLYAEGMSQGKIGERFGVGQRAISYAIAGRNWGHVE